MSLEESLCPDAVEEQMRNIRMQGEKAADVIGDDRCGDDAGVQAARAFGRPENVPDRHA